MKNPIENTGAASMSRRLADRINRHDLEGFVACFDAGYRSEQPAHPGRAFQGPATVRRHWSRFFDRIPDFQAEILRSVAAEDTEWAEWRWHGTTVEGHPFEVRGVIVLRHRDGRVSWAHLYMEPVESESRQHSV